MDCKKKMGSRGEIVIPRRLREKFGLKPNKIVDLVETADGLLISTSQKKISDFKGILGKSKIDMTELDLITEEYMGGLL